MIANIEEIFQSELNQTPIAIAPILGLGMVNQVYEVKCKNQAYVIRLNNHQEKHLEYLKERWCLREANVLGIPSPSVLAIGKKKDLIFMIQNKIEGINGSLCDTAAKLKIWEKLGAYALKFSQIKNIEIPALNKAEFHENWQGRLAYNLEQLVATDSLITDKVFSTPHHQLLKTILSTLLNKKYTTGLIHGDLCPRNVIVQSKQIYLVDWGTAGINIIPHTEIGKIQEEGEANPTEIQSFLKGLQITNQQYRAINKEVRIIHLLNELDTYRWASSYTPKQIKGYQDKVKKAFSLVEIEW